MASSFFNTNTLKLESSKKIYFVLLKIFFGVGLLWFIISKIKPSELINSISHANLFFIIASISLLIFNLFFQYKKWQLTCTCLLAENDKKKVLYSLFFGIVGGSFTPVRAGEYFGRSIEFKHKPFIEVSAATLIDKLFLLVVITFAGSVSSVIFLNVYYNITFYITLSLFVVIFVFYYLLILIVLSEKFWNILSLNSFKSTIRLKPFIERLKIIKQLDKQYSAKMIMWSLLLYICYTFQFALLVAGFTNHPRLFHFFWAGNLMMFAKTIIPSFTFAEIGIREGAAIFFLTKMGETSSAAFSASIFLLIINILIPSVIGLILLFKKNNA